MTAAVIEGVSRATSTRRLNKLANFLEALPPDRFDYTIWVGREWKGAPDLSCGTTACALGWAAAMPEFQRLGLSLYAPLGSGGLAEPVNEKTGSSELDAAQEIFGLTYDEAAFLFMPGREYGDIGGSPESPDDEATSKDVARHIRTFIRDRDKLAALLL